MLSKRIIGAACVLVMMTQSCARQEPTPSLPDVATTAVTSIGTNVALSGGMIQSASGAEVLSRGVCWSTHPYPTIQNEKTSDGNGSGTFSSSLTGLQPNKDYYLRAYAVTPKGTSYGNSVAFSTLVTDNDGNVYHTVTIGIQIWMTENLRVTQLTDGTPIPEIKENKDWGFADFGLCWYENDAPRYKNPYGALYDWNLVATGKLCPTGWHVPTDNDWTLLTNFLGGESGAGDKLKERGADHWLTFNEASNSSGFTAIPGGSRGFDGSFNSLGDGGGWWSSTPDGGNRSWGRFMASGSSSVFRTSFQRMNGFSVRCIKTVH
ncbi:MAG: fibrobacter succinogenes major paralogous domain-containing protein [Bacteroidetes bacterium]|nr:fibrobacter succinogenes major paralogous domain-containing protein [Bacteroidota bacterium]